VTSLNFEAQIFEDKVGIGSIAKVHVLERDVSNRWPVSSNFDGLSTSGRCLNLLGNFLKFEEFLYGDQILLDFVSAVH